jgi:hypothetical protein
VLEGFILKQSVLAEAGEYHGPANMEEYIRFATTSDYIQERVQTSAIPQFQGMDSITGTCYFIIFNANQYTMNPEYALETTFNQSNLIKIMYEIEGNYVAQVNVYFTKEFLEFIFGRVLYTEVRTYRYNTIVVCVIGY